MRETMRQDIKVFSGMLLLTFAAQRDKPSGSPGMRPREASSESIRLGTFPGCAR